MSHEFGRGLKNRLALKSFRTLMAATARRGARGLEHIEDREDCWCRPELFELCPEACCEVHGCAETCWRCGGSGMVEAAEESCDTEIVHRCL